MAHRSGKTVTKLASTGLVARFGIDGAIETHSAAETHGATEPAKRGWHLLFRYGGPSMARSRAIPGASRSRCHPLLADTADISCLSLLQKSVCPHLSTADVSCLSLLQNSVCPHLSQKVSVPTKHPQNSGRIGHARNSGVTVLRFDVPALFSPAILPAAGGVFPPPSLRRAARCACCRCERVHGGCRRRWQRGRAVRPLRR